ncbi:hypothetical protein KY312_04790, partial [Candidatus Woesearchaeota archaeon]|nr:hypothetical protein [Candidatus Woesearchaeota archaeon]
VTNTTDIEILDSDIELANPDYWAVSRAIVSKPGALDRQTTQLARQRMYFDVDFSTSENIELVSAELASCRGETEYLESAYMRGEYIVLELGSFNSEEIEKLEFDCTINLYTRRGKKVTFNPEVENVNLTVNFYNFGLGGVATNLAEKIDKEKKKVETGFWGAIGDLEMFMSYVRILCSFVNVAVYVNKMINFANAGLEGLRNTAFGSPAAIAGCAALEGTNVGISSVVGFMQDVCLFVSCSPNPKLGRYAAYQGIILNMYNAWTLKGPFGMAKTTSLYDNLILSTAGLCVPGMIYNLNKLRQIQCRYIYCLENEVPTGIATIESCRELKDYQECKYVWGEVFQFITFVPVLDAAAAFLKSFLTDPVGIIRAIIVYGCVLWCPASNSKTTLCDIGAWVVLAIDLANDIVSGFTQAKTIRQDYCSRVL